MDLEALLERFCPPLGPAGFEEEIRDALMAYLKTLARRMEVDRLGNLQVWLGPEGGPRIMLDAHMDECGLMVQRVEKEGWLRVAALGGVDQRILPGSRVILQPEPGNQVEGVIGLAPPHVSEKGDRDKSVPWDQTFVDIGVSDENQAKALGVDTGTPGVLELGMSRLAGGCFQARNLDDRAGCAALCALAQRLADEPPPMEVVLNFAVGEELGLRGATTAAYALKPDLALCLEATIGDTPGLSAGRQPSLLGKGPAITVADGRIVVPRRLVNSLEQAARQAGVACQRKLPPYGGTDAGAIHLSRAGVPTCIVAVPCRYIHTPASILNLDDLNATVELSHVWLKHAEALL
jgi:putative aminopeptidase FrvX